MKNQNMAVLIWFSSLFKKLIYIYTQMTFFKTEKASECWMDERRVAKEEVDYRIARNQKFVFISLLIGDNALCGTECF